MHNHFCSLKKIRIPSLWLLIGISLLLIAHSKALASQIVFGLDTTPDRLIPIKIKNPQSFPVSMQIFEGLFDLNEQGKIIPKLIKKWDTEDFMTWTFQVRKGVYFHKSFIFRNETREVKAEDVLYSLTRFCSADSYNAFLLVDTVKGAAEFNQGKVERVSGFKVIDDYTLQVNLIRPAPFFINNLSTALMAVYPKEADQEEFTDNIGLSIAVGTGPYMLESRTETEIVLIKNKNYWDKKNEPQLDRIIFRVIKNDQARFVGLQRGTIDLLVLPNSLFPSVFKRDGKLRDYISKKYQIKTAATYNTHFIGINNKIITDKNLRQAIFWATNRDEIIETLLYGFADKTGGTVPPRMNGYNPPFKKELFDSEKAKTYLNKSSYKGEPLELLVHDIGNSEQVAQIFQAQMANIGIQIVLKKMDFNSVINSMVKGEAELFSMFFEYVFSSPEPILINLYSSSKIPVPNFFHFINPSVDSMLESLHFIRDRQESVSYCSQIEGKVMEEAPAIFLYRQKYVILYPNNMIGLEVSGNNHYFLEKIKIQE